MRPASTPVSRASGPASRTAASPWWRRPPSPWPSGSRRDQLWDRLDDGVRQRAAAWLAGALTAEPWPCNWELFPVTVGGFLADIGYEPDASRAAIDRGLERIERWYVGEGWYTDGDGRKYDYYNGWAMHLYPVLHAWLEQDERCWRCTATASPGT